MASKNIQLKTFKIRLSKNKNKKDIEKINKFLKSVKIIKTYSNAYSGEPNYWSMVIHYESN